MNARKAIQVLTIAAAILWFAQLAAAQHYQQTNLVSDLPGIARITDPNLVNPWGLTRSGTSPWWVSDNGTGVSTLYNGNTGAPLSLVVTIPGATGGTGNPTGTVFNGGPGFVVTSGTRSGPAVFIFVSEDGAISGWNPNVEATRAVIAVNNSPSEAIYKGVTLAQFNGATYLYAANFHAGTIEVYNSSFQPATLSGSFTDPDLPAGFAPFNVQTIGSTIYVMYAKQDAAAEDEVAGAGLGFVDAYDTGGNLLMRLKHGRWLDAPWGIALAPSNFGKFSNELLVGQFGSGEIAVYNPSTGNFHGLLRGPVGHPITIDGLWALGFGNGANAGPANTLFFTAGIDDEAHGLFGTITPIPNGNFDGDNN